MNRSTDDIETPRLLLRLLSPVALRAGLLGDLATVERSLGATVPTDLLDDLGALAFSQAQLEVDPGYLPWSARAMVLRESMSMIGRIRFHTRPDPDYLHIHARNAVEFGYDVFASHRRKGYAAEALAGTMSWAKATHGIGRFVLSISPANIPSRNLALKFGFVKVGAHDDPVDGTEDVYLLDSTANS